MGYFGDGLEGFTVDLGQWVLMGLWEKRLGWRGLMVDCWDEEAHNITESQRQRC